MPVTHSHKGLVGAAIGLVGSEHHAGASLYRNDFRHECGLYTGDLFTVVPKAALLARVRPYYKTAGAGRQPAGGCFDSRMTRKRE
jgi:hypothetical protein